MNISVDFLVIGAGPAGVTAAMELSHTGKKVAVIGKQLGGVYAVEGCAGFNLINQFANMFEDYRRISSGFIEGGAAGKLDSKKLRKHLESNTTKVRKAFADELEDCDVEYYEGSAEFIAQDKVKVTRHDQEEIICTFGKCLIATGSSSRKFASATGRKLPDVSSIAAIDNVPATAVVVGGGIIGMEVAMILSKFGSKVTVIEKEDRILKCIDPVLAKKYEDILKKRDITIITGGTALSIERIGQKYVLFYNESKIESEEVVFCIGREPLVTGLNLEAAGVNVLDGRPVFGMDLQTDNKNIYVAGDVADVRMHVSWAYHSALVAAANMVGDSRKYEPKLLTSIASVGQEVICIGLSEDEAKQEGYDVGVIKYSGNDIFRNIVATGNNLFVKALYNKADKMLLGCQVMGYCAFDIVSLCSFMIQSGVSADRLADFVYIRPLFNEFFKDISMKLK